MTLEQLKEAKKKVMKDWIELDRLINKKIWQEGKKQRDQKFFYAPLEQVEKEQEEVKILMKEVFKFKKEETIKEKDLFEALHWRHICEKAKGAIPVLTKIIDYALEEKYRAEESEIEWKHKIYVRGAKHGNK